MQKLQLNLTIEEVNTVLTALSKAPYELVAALISNIQGQANEQLQAIPKEPTDSP